jgi:hypothetical protein
MHSCRGDNENRTRRDDSYVFAMMEIDSMGNVEKSALRTTRNRIKLPKYRTGN